jgi:arylsulfatase
VLIYSGWVAYPMMKIVREFEESLETYPSIKVGTPDPYVPPASTGRRDRAGAKP